LGDTTIVHKFGGHNAIGTVFEPVCGLGLYRTPQVAGATALRVKAGNAADTAAGAGAREITFEYLNATGALVVEAIATAGASASANTSTTAIRLLRAYVSASGSYFDPNVTLVGSHTAAIVIENAAGTEDWASIELDATLPLAQTLISCYTVPLGKRAFIGNLTFQADTNKAIDAVMAFRENILETSPPYKAARGIIHVDELQDRWTLTKPFPHYFPALTDLIFLAHVTAGTGDVNIAYDIILEDAR
jgi:hypothetical protein